MKTSTRYISTNVLDVNLDAPIGAYRWDAANGWLATAATVS
jgi:hypothetical protein